MRGLIAIAVAVGIADAVIRRLARSGDSDAIEELKRQIDRRAPTAQALADALDPRQRAALRDAALSWDGILLDREMGRVLDAFGLIYNVAPSSTNGRWVASEFGFEVASLASDSLRTLADVRPVLTAMGVTFEDGDDNSLLLTAHRGADLTGIRISPTVTGQLQWTAQRNQPVEGRPHESWSGPIDSAMDIEWLIEAAPQFLGSRALPAG